MTNAYKSVWQEFTPGQRTGIKKSLARSLDKRRKKTKISLYAIAKKQAEQEAVLRTAKRTSRYLARNQVRGAIGITGRVAGRIGMRLVPVVGWALNAYDAYQVAKYVKEEYID